MPDCRGLDEPKSDFIGEIIVGFNFIYFERIIREVPDSRLQREMTRMSLNYY